MLSAYCTLPSFFLLFASVLSNDGASQTHSLTYVLEPATAHFWNHTSSGLGEPQKRICYNEEERTIPVNIQNCLPVTRKMIRMRRSEQLRIFKGSSCPIAITDYGTACTITLESDSMSDEDYFSFRAVALEAYSILEICQTPGLGGRARLGTKGFRVKVDAIEPQVEEILLP